MPDPKDRSPRVFVSEPIRPLGGFHVSRLATGLTSPPKAFEWRGRRYRIHRALHEAKVSEPEGHRDGGERYLRREEFEVELEGGATATIYFVRNPTDASSRSRRDRWFLYDIDSGALKNPITMDESTTT